LRIYIDIGHPAYAHAFRHFIVEMKQRGHQVLVSARDKDITYCLLQAWDIDFTGRGTGYQQPGRGLDNSGKPEEGSGIWLWFKSIAALFGKVIYLFSSVFKLLPVVRKFDPGLVMSFSSYHAALIGRLLGKPVLTFEDTEDVSFLHPVNRALSTRMITPACFEKDFGRKHIRFDGYKELASLHPARFVSQPLPASVNKPYILIRFVSWLAYHDMGHQGIGEEMKFRIVERLSEFGTVYISSEKPLSSRLEPYRLPVSCEMGHSVLAGASLLFGESASMAAEAAMLGVPAIFIDNTGRGYTRELEEKHRLIFNFSEDNSDVERALDKAATLLGRGDIREEWLMKRDTMLTGKVDLTSWMIGLAESFSDESPTNQGIQKEMNSKSD